MDVPTIADDVLHCSVYVPEDEDPAVLLTRIMLFVEQTIPNHIWHRDSFELTLSKEEENMLECIIRVGDSIDDEWLVVYLLWHITKMFQVAVSVYDADGEFLLIEAADELPSWVRPENVEHRVWIYGGHLHIIPLSHTSSTPVKNRRRRRLNQADPGYEGAQTGTDDDVYLNVLDALKLLRDTNVETRVSTPVENIILARIERFPEGAKNQIHRTKAALPVDIARALAGNPHLVQKAVECFYTRDALQLRVTQKMARFPPSTSSVVTIRLTRTAYAQLMGQRFNAPRIFRRPLNQTAEESRWWDNGVKIACGFEMLYQEARSKKDGLRVNASEEMNEARLDALRRDPNFIQYIAKLEHTTYFEGELKDSEQWKKKEHQAAQTWIAMRQADDASRPSFAGLVGAALQSASNIEPRDEGEDPDDWLNVEPMELETSLNRYSKSDGAADHPSEAEAQTNSISQSAQPPLTSKAAHGAQKAHIMDLDEDDEQETEEDRLANQQAHRLKALADKMEGFVEGEGVMEGAIFDDDLLSDEDEEMDSDDDSEEEKKRRQVAMDALVAPLEPGEYGKMPVEYRHANSQMTAPAEDESSNNVPAAAHPSSSNIPNVAQSKPIRRPIFQRDKFDGVDSDDESSEEDEGFGPATKAEIVNEEEEEEEEYQPQVVGDVEIDMAQEEEDFLQFSREALGIDDAAWTNIIADREKRGAYIPQSARKDKSQGQTQAKTHDGQAIPIPTKETPVPNRGPNAARFFDEIPKIAVTERQPRKQKEKGGDGTTDREPNPDLDSFEAVMDAMEKELARLTGPLPPSPSSFSPLPRSSNRSSAKKAKSEKKDVKGKGKATDTSIGMGKNMDVDMNEDGGDSDDEDDMAELQAAMDRELTSSLKRDKRDIKVVSSGSEDDEDDEGAYEGEVPMDYNLIKNFLESFKSQQGLSGPVGGLAGRLQGPSWTFPRDNS